MSSIEAWLIIILVLGVIASNIAVLKYSAKFKMPQFGKPEEKPTSKSDSDIGSDSASASASATDDDAIDAEVSPENKDSTVGSKSPVAKGEEPENAAPTGCTDNEDSKNSHLL